MTPITKGILSAVLVIGLGLGVSVSFQNCAELRTSRISASEKAQYLASSHIFAGEVYSAPSPNAEAVEFGGTPTGEATGVVTQPYEVMPTGAFPLRLMCSDAGSLNNKPSWGGAAALATNLRFRLVNYDSAGNLNTVCDFTVPNTNELKDQMMNKKEMPLAFLAQNCPNVPAGRYHLLINDPTAPADKPTTIYAKNLKANVNYLTAIKNSKPGEDLEIVKSADGWATNERAQFILADRNPHSSIVTQPFAFLTSASQCDQEASPLMIKLSGLSGQDGVGLRLTSRQNGVLFDVLGESITPAFTKMQVSWVTDDNFAFIVFPNANGQVLGVNEMFGDRTKGPDGDFALNGYEALRKWDGRPVPGQSGVGGLPDGVIDASDPIYGALRLWIDSNRDGIATPTELYALSQFKIKLFDLNYDPRYYERDLYGNQIRYKSVAQSQDGRLYTVFDLWFNYDGDQGQ